ncbi:MAG: heavy metal-associated domain-containing protein [Patescibacteria group bacterium]|jgi:copper chaperone CopZ
MSTLNFSLVGSFECAACTKLVSMKLREIDGVTDAVVNLNGSVSVEAEREIDLYEIADALRGTDHPLAEE